MASNARNLANLLGTGQSTISAEKLGSDVPPGTEDYSSIDSLGVGTTIGETAFVEATNRLYIWNGSGWYNIALINTTPTWDSGGQPGGSYVLDGDSPQGATVITLAASDPEGLPISYNYITSGSMDSIATISQDSSVFTITPKTSVQAPDGGTGSITFRVTDGINILPQVSSFTLNFVTLIENSRHTTLLATAVDTSDNNNITDSSTNNHSITVNGDTYAGSFSPYRSGGYSTYFDGTGDYLTIPQTSNVGNFGTGEFTVELWFKPINVDDQMYFVDFRTSVAGFQISRRNNNTIRVRNGGTTLITGSTQLTDFDTWYHVLVHRNSNNELKLFVNGTQEGGTITGHTDNYVADTSGVWCIAQDYSGSNRVDGYMTDLRVTQGEAITPPSGGPTERLSATSNTKFLYSGTGYIADTHNSTPSSNHSITVNGNPSTKPFSPYDYLEYSATDHGGSVYFDRVSYNSGACVTVADHNDFTLGTSDWTVKFWVYHNELSTSGGTAYGYFSNYYFNTPGGFGLKWMQQWGNKPVLEYMNSGAYAKKIFDFVPSAKIWYYYELACSSSTVTFKVDGETIGTQSVPDLGNPDRTLIVGAASNGSSGVENFLGGYIADFQYVIGGTASESSVPTVPMSTDSNAALHIKGTDASIIDKSQSTNLKLVGNTTGSTTQVKFADTKSMYFDGTGDGIVVPHRDELNLDGCDWTIEYWFNVTNPGAIANWNLIQKGDNTTVRPYQINFRLDNNNGVEPRLFVSPNNSSQAGISNNAWQTFNAWHHVAFVRINSTGVITRYINGTANGTATSDVATNTEDLYIGTVPSGADEEGYIQDLRITKGLARYTANFTPPTASLEG